MQRINGLEFVSSDVHGAVHTFANLKVEGMALASCVATLTNFPHIELYTVDIYYVLC